MGIERPFEPLVAINRTRGLLLAREQYRHSLGLGECPDCGPLAEIDALYVRAIAAADWPAVRALADRLAGTGLYRESRDAEVARLTDRIMGAMQWFPGPLFFAVDALQAIGELPLTEALESRGVVVEAGCQATPGTPASGARRLGGASEIVFGMDGRLYGRISMSSIDTSLDRDAG